ncbi:MAG: hypothetical protein NTU41_08165 [Chloroflexi bacterium]|nr:hypothetical protein [Chloroflexota bacterium]
MPSRADESLRQQLYGGHPPACTCVACERRRLAKLNRKPRWKQVLGKILPWVK